MPSAPIDYRPLRRRIAVALAIMSFLFLWLSKFVPDGTPLKLRLSVLDNLAEVMFLFFTAGCILKYLLTRDRITLDILSGAACVYILFGISWGVLYSFLERVAPGSFAFAGHFSPEQGAQPGTPRGFRTH